MKVHNMSLGFCAKSKKDESANSNIFLCALGGSAIGAAGGAVARNYVPFSDEFSSKSVESKHKIEKSLDNFIEDYSLLEIQEARALKTVLIQPDVSVYKDQSLRIKELIEDESIKPVGQEDSEELQSTFKALHSQTLDEIKEAETNKTLPDKIKSIDEMTLDVHSKAKTAVFVRENLKKFKNQIKGLVNGGNQSLSSIRSNISTFNEGTTEMKKELNSAFDYMIKSAKNTQRPIESWTIIPGIVCGFLGMGIAIYSQLKKDIINNKKEPA